MLAFHVAFEIGEVAPAAGADTLSDPALDLRDLAFEGGAAAVRMVDSVAKAVVLVALGVELTPQSRGLTDHVNLSVTIWAVERLAHVLPHLFVEILRHAEVDAALIAGLNHVGPGVRKRRVHTVTPSRLWRAHKIPVSSSRHHSVVPPPLARSRMSTASCG